MKRLLGPVLLAGWLTIMLAACGTVAAEPLRFAPAPWADGEVSLYDITGRDGASLGTAQWAWRRIPEGWSQTYEMVVAGRPDRGEVILSDSLTSLRSWRETGGKRYEATYGSTVITVTTREADERTTSKTLKRPVDSIDNDLGLQAQRALPLAAGYAARYSDVIPTTGAVAPIQVKVVEEEDVTVPAGTFAAWRVELDFGSGKHDAWYGKDAPRALLKYVNRASGAMFVLRSLGQGQPSPATGAAVTASTPPNPAAEPAAPPPAKVNVPMLLSALLIQAPLMVIFPFALGWWIRRRYGIGWRVFGAGVLAFVGSQIVHLPLNYALGLLGGGRGVALWPLPLMALVAGLSAGVCEEGARWIVLRFFLRKTRGWRSALQFGAGHGGAESVIFGLLALLSLLSMLVLSSLSPTTLGLPAATSGQIAAARSLYWSSPWYLPIVGGVERLFAIAIQMALTQTVMLSFTRKNLAYLLAAIGLHTAVDFWAVWAGPKVSTFGLEAGVAVCAAASLLLILRLREPAAASTSPTSTTAPTADDLAPRELSPAELARRAEESRYDRRS